MPHSFNLREYHFLGDVRHHGAALNAMVLHNLAVVFLRGFAGVFVGDGVEGGLRNQMLRKEGRRSKEHGEQKFHDAKGTTVVHEARCHPERSEDLRYAGVLWEDGRIATGAQR